MKERLSIFAAAMRERVAHDLGPLRGATEAMARASAAALLRSPFVELQAKGFGLLMRLHRAGLSAVDDDYVALRLREAIHREKSGFSTGLWRLLDNTLAGAVASLRSRNGPRPERLVGTRIFVIKRWEHGERGVLVVDYEYALPLLVGLFDIVKVCQRYDLVLEPSWAGVCAPELFIYSRLPRPVTVQTMEPRDARLLDVVGVNLDVVPIAANWWADPGPAYSSATERDIDVAMVAAWAGIKRHWRFFRALGALRSRGTRLKVALVGYPGDMSKADLENQARIYGVLDQLEFHERISETEVRSILRRSKIHVLWSRREASGRAIIEALLQDTPVIVREGLTFGHRYEYINEQTGAFVSERDLESAMLSMIEQRARYSPRNWVLGHITSQHATRILEEHLKARAIRNEERWTRGLVAKVSALDAQRYLNAVDQKQFASDYEFLKSVALETS